jgi:hypothetical protein
VADVLASHGSNPLVDELTRAVADLERLTDEGRNHR